MTIILTIFLILNLLLNSLIIYLMFRDKREKGGKQEPLVKIFTAGKGEVVEWQPKEEEEKKAEDKIREDLDL